MIFEETEQEYETPDKDFSSGRMERIEELKKIRDGIFYDELEQLLLIGKKDMIESAIDSTDNKDKLESWKKKLLEENSENNPDIKELVLKIQKRKK